MSYTNKLDLNIGKDCLDNWDISHAIRELIANAIDEHTESKIKKPIVIRQNRNNYEIIDYGRGIKQQDFIHKTNKIKTSGGKMCIKVY
jgi:DNA gyrase/topoisomerase IV subunit B